MNSTADTKEEKKPLRTAIKLVIVAIILIFLVFLSVGIVKVVPKALNSLASASLSIGNVFSGNASSTPGTDTNTDANASNAAQVATTTHNGRGGFSIRDLTNPSASSTQNWVPAPAGTNTSPRPNSASTGGPNNPSNWNGGSNSSSNSSSNTSSGSHTSTSNDNGQASNPNYRTVGPSDIAVEIISKGIISKTTGQFIPTNTFSTDDMVVVKFKVENRGLYATGPWTARVDMPSNDASDRVRTLGPVNSLFAGSAITGEARFDHPVAGNQVVTIAVDTASATNDQNRSNNTATSQIYSAGTNYGNGNGSYNSGTSGDLQTTILQTGTVDMFGQFVANSYPRVGQKIAVRFQVTNVGGTTVPVWAWRADLGGSTYNTYSAQESGLAPGASTRIIVGFDTVNYGASTITITADSNNQIYEPNESNNASSVTVNTNW